MTLKDAVYIIALVLLYGLAGALDNDNSELNHIIHNLTFSNGDSQ